MKSGLAIPVLAIAAGLSFGQTKESVDLFLNRRDASSELLGRATPLASEIFKKIGVRLNWHSGELPAGKAGFGIRTTEHAPESATPEALASARLTGSGGVEITVYKDRLQRFLSDRPSLAGVAAAYVLAHELAHAMQGVARHSESGIMKARWGDLDFQGMVFHKLMFAPVDVELIHHGLAALLGTGSTEALNR
jgi:hypothetical protein